ncbi:MAG: hypothetical protein JXA28_11455 [Bacteroidetes bacterium]|nr:hypothetical protein [Bacteroidota bacterium]
MSSLETVNIEAIIERQDGSLVVGDEEGVFFGSADMMQWRLSRPSWWAVMTLAENGSGRILAGTLGDGVYLTDDDGFSWEAGDLEGSWVTGLVVPDAVYCYASTRENGVFESRDGGVTWSPYNSGLFSHEVYDLYPGGDGHLYAATGEGVARTSYRVLMNDYLTPGFTLELNVPNPVRNGTVFGWSVPREGHARMVLHDVLGRRVRVEFDRRVSAGLYWHTVDATGLIPGTYFCVLTFEGEMLDRKFQVVR